MKQRLVRSLTPLPLAAIIAALPGIYAHAASGTFTTEPDRTMERAHESFLKGQKDKAAADLHEAGEWVKRQSDKVSVESKARMKATGLELDKLGDGVKDGTVKTDAELKKGFAKVDHSIATCWHQTAESSKAAGKDSTEALRESGVALENSAKWSGHQLSEGTRESVAAVKKAGRAAGEGGKAAAEDVDKWFKGIGEGIKDLGRKL